MKYRKLGKTGLEVSELSIGCEYVWHSDREAVESLVKEAVSAGVNYIDIFIGTPETRAYFGYALEGVREKVILAGHLGCGEKDGQYVKTRNLKLCKQYIEDFYEKLQTDYIDVLFLHNCDEEKDLDEIMEKGMYDMAKELQSEGRARFIGFSSHNTKTALKAVRSGKIDVLMFPINPLFDMLPRNIGHAKMFDAEAQETLTEEEKMNYPTKEELYQACEEMGVGLIAMKPFAGGNLLKDHHGGLIQGMLSLTPVQCISYILSNTAVSCAVPGFKTPEEFRKAYEYFSASEEEKDFSCIKESKLYGFAGQCMYCNHCQPCPKDIDIAAVMEFRDKALKGITEDVIKEYKALKVKPEECIQCGSCNKRCPFQIDAVSGIKQAAELAKEFA